MTPVNTFSKLVEDRNIRKLTRTGFEGRSMSVTIPKEVVGELGWKDRQKVIVNRKGVEIIIKELVPGLLPYIF